MSYVNGKKVFPKDILELVQSFVDGEYVYIPRKEEHKKLWGEGTQSRQETIARNQEIYQKHQAGASPSDLSQQYFLSEKSIRRILLEQKKNGK